jgi:hypothetical protein
MESDLSTATLPELIAEIQRRTEASLIVLDMAARAGDEHHGAPQIGWSGGAFAALGLCETANVALKQTIFRDRRPADGFAQDAEILDDDE